jgi:protein O-mannosyl-transferase
LGGQRLVAETAQSVGDSSPWTIAAALAIIGLAAVAAYQNSFAGVFLLDDRPWIVENADIRRLWPIWRILFQPSDVLVGGRPMVTLTLAVNYALGGLNLWGYHAVNLSIHIAAAWTLLGIVRRTLLLPPLNKHLGSVALPLAFVAAMLWMLHPLQTESVTYVIQRTEALVGLFYLLTLYCVIRGASANNAIAWYVAATAACLLGMATKEVMATAPMVVLLYDRTFLAGSFRDAWRRRYGLYLAMAATWGAVAMLLISTGFYGGTAGFAVHRFTSWSYLLTQSGVIVHYLRLAFWPSALCFDYNWPPAQTVSEILLPAIVVLGLLGLTVWALVKRPAWGFLGACFFVILAPTSSLVPIQDATFDHRMYLSLAALAVGATIGLWLLGQRLVHRRTISPWTAQFAGGLLAAFAAVALGTLAFQRNSDYRSELSMWQDTVAKAPDNQRAYNCLGLALADEGRFDEAIVQYRKSLEINPSDAEAHNYLGMALAACRRLDEAIACYRKALEIKPNAARAHNNLGNALASSGKADEALSHFQSAVEIDPNFAEAHNNLGNALENRGRNDEAMLQFEKALDIRPDYDSAHNNLGIALAGRGRIDEAIVHFRKALDAKPDLAPAHNNLGLALASSGHVDEAVVHFRRALEIQPDFAQARKNLEAALRRNGNPPAKP